MGDGIGFADVGEKFIAQSFTFGGTSDQTCDVDELDNRGLHALWVDDFGQLVHARIGHFDNADIRLDGAKWIVFSGNARFGQRVEKG